MRGAWMKSFAFCFVLFEALKTSAFLQTHRACISGFHNPSPPLQTQTRPCFRSNTHYKLRPIVHGLKESQTALFGIPKLFRWLIDLYPVTVEAVQDAYHAESMQIDNFYLDMNGIIHACTHANTDNLVDLNEQQMFLRIFKYTDQLFKLVRPKKLLYLAVDGVAPRAKMNQQRSRRFRSAREREEMLLLRPTDTLSSANAFDSNCITPGTDFMHRLGRAFHLWIEHKMETDWFWKRGAQVVFSGPEVPGEGEHKIMDRLRTDQQTDRERSRSLRHCMYGLDADLIMLGLVTHEPQFVLLREKQVMGVKKDPARQITPQDFEVLEVSILRKMLKLHVKESIEKHLRENRKKKQPDPFKVPLDLERVIDDLVFICFFIGNDFLPTLPHLDISDGAIVLLIDTYCSLLCKTGGGYLTHKHKLHLPRIELFVQEISRREPLYFEHRAVEESDDQYASEEYKDYYYLTKFGLLPSDKEAKRRVVHKYLEGLAWVLSYYHRGCVSWTWFYPHLYAPLASDLRDLGGLPLSFEAGKPFTPLLQLLSVLPPQSSKFLPRSYQQLMQSQSPLAPYYPDHFEVDLNGKKNSWESVVQIPFIEEKLLLNTVSCIDHDKQLSIREKARNRFGTEKLYDPTGREKQ